MNRPVLKIALKPHLADFCRHEFKSHKKELILSRRSDIGKFIYSNITTSEFPVKPKAFTSGDVVTFAIPVSKENHYILSHRFITMQPWAITKVNDYLEAEFNRRVRDTFEMGYKLHMAQKEIIETILQTYNINNSVINYEAIKKCDYRKRKKFRKMMLETLQRAAL